MMPAQVQENVMAAQVQGSVMAMQVQGNVMAAQVGEDESPGAFVGCHWPCPCEEQLRRALAESQQRLLNVVAESIDRRLTEKEAEVDYEKCRSTELEERLALLRSQSMAWQTRAIAGRAVVSSLHAQIHQVVSRPPVDER
ncbi:hypothetical protein AXF42_Ash000210 [Apostasia shenzhenica]|uniref:Uncharacterized protein n=1 Tax=Apostasia shenzhenica TaxID=1088818 RepID=A0A2I0AFR0_9ASPA|nr:hypothetical protein AXF42_Ash000210 [Apostasia shenzhenica]